MCTVPSNEFHMKMILCDMKNTADCNHWDTVITISTVDQWLRAWSF